MPHYERVIDACCFLFMFVNMGITSTTFNIFQPYINALPSMGDTSGSLVVATRMLFGFFATFFVSRYYKLFDCRLGITLACLLTAIGFTVYSQADTFMLFALGAALNGISYGLGGTVGMTLLVGRWFSENKGTALGIASMGTGLAAILLPIVSIHIIENASLEQAFQFEALISICVAIIVYVLLRNRPSESITIVLHQAFHHPRQYFVSNLKTYASEKCVNNNHVKPSDKFNDAGLTKNKTCASNKKTDDNFWKKTGSSKKKLSISNSTLLPNHYFHFMLLAIFLLGMNSIGSNAYFSVLLKTNGFDAKFIAFILSLTGVSLLSFKFIAGILFDKYGTKRASIILFVLFAGGMLCNCLTFLQQPVLVCFAAVAVYAGLPIASIGISEWALEFSDPKQRVHTVQHFQLFFTAGTFCANLFPGFLYDHVGNYEISYAIFAISVLVAMFIFLCAFRHLHKTN